MAYFTIRHFIKLLVPALLCAASARAQIFANDEAAAYTLANWTNGVNLGFGFGPWTLRQTGTGGDNYTGFFLANNNDPISSTNGNAWGMYANGSSGTNAAVAFRALAAPMAANTVFKLKWHSKGIGFSGNNDGGFCLRHGNTNASTADFNAGSRFMFHYLGGGYDSFLIEDNSGTQYAYLPFGSNPFQVEFTLLVSNRYRLEIKDASGSNILTSLSDMVLIGTNSIDSIAMFARQTDGDQLFNNMQLASTSLTPPQITSIFPMSGSIYVPVTDQIGFNAISAFSTLPTNGFIVLLNGVTQSNLTVSGFPSNRFVVVNDPLPNNRVLTATIIVTDANGNRATNSSTFNTWGSNNPFIEAEDYNFSAGGWINNLTNQPNQNYRGLDTNFNFYGLFGTNGIDYLEFDLSGSSNSFNNYYRAYDLPQVQYCFDLDHHHFSDFFFSDFNLAYNQTGEWQNYTRQLSNTTYEVYARMAGFGTRPAMLLERLASPLATSASQGRAALGSFLCPPDTGGVQNYTFVPLTDLFGNPARQRLPGTNTFRCTSVGTSGTYNFTYLVLIPAANTNTILPYISAGSPAPGIRMVAPDPLVTFTIANGQTAVVPASIQLFLNNSNVSAGLTLSNNSAGTLASFQPVGKVPFNSTNTLRVVFNDGSISQTNQWQFTVSDIPSIASASAVPGTINPVDGSVQVNFSATLNPGNLPTAVTFLYGLTTNYGGSTAPITTAFNTNSIAVATSVNGFSQGLLYHFCVAATNQSGGVQTADQTFVIAGGGAGTNTAPQISNFADAQTAANTPLGPIAFAVSDAQTPAASLTVTAAAGNTNLVPPAGLVFGGSGTNRTLTITPAAGQRGTCAILVGVSDGTTTTAKGFILGVGVLSGDLDFNGLVSQAELNSVLSNYWPSSPWLYMTNVAGLGGTNVTFALSNSTAGAFSVQYTTNFTNWQFLGPAIPRYLFTDTNAPALPQRYYRLRWP